jgi:glyoxylase-like metal-dependent hydrolase (beta-lactamase superfamily II)
MLITSWGNAFFPGVIVTSEHNREHFLDSVKSNENVRKMFLQFFPNSGDITKSYNLRWPDITFRQRMSLCLGGTEFLILCSPGHTLGQTIVHVPGERVLMAADNIVYGAPPFFHAADLSCWFGSLAMLESLDVEWFIPGHGIPCKKDWIPRLREILYGIINEVRKAKKCGLSRQEAQRAVQYIDRPEFEFPDFLAEACRNLEEVGIGNIYDQLEAHPGL